VRRSEDGATGAATTLPCVSMLPIASQIGAPHGPVAPPRPARSPIPRLTPRALDLSRLRLRTAGVDLAIAHLVADVRAHPRDRHEGATRAAKPARNEPRSAPAPLRAAARHGRRDRDFDSARVGFVERRAISRGFGPFWRSRTKSRKSSCASPSFNFRDPDLPGLISSEPLCGIPGPWRVYRE